MMKSYLKTLIWTTLITSTINHQCIPDGTEEIEKCNKALKTVYTKTIEECIDSPYLDISDIPSETELYALYPISTYLYYKEEINKKEKSVLSNFEKQIINITQTYSDRIIYDKDCRNLAITQSKVTESLQALKEFAQALDQEVKKNIDDISLLNFFPQFPPYLLQGESRIYPVRSLFSTLAHSFNFQILKRKLDKLSERIDSTVEAVKGTILLLDATKTDEESHSTLLPETSLSTLLGQTLENTTPTSPSTLLEQTLENTTPTESIRQTRITTDPTNTSAVNPTKHRELPTLVDLDRKIGKLYRKQIKLLNLQNRTETLLEVAKKCETCSIFHNYILIAIIIAVILYTSLIILTTSWWVYDNLHLKQRKLDIHELQPRYNPSAPSISIEECEEIEPLRQCPSPPRSKYRIQKITKQAKIQ